MFEMEGVPEDQAREAMRLATHKLPVKCKFVTKKIIEEMKNKNIAEKEAKAAQK
jgi:large subunit ribosomal protein L16